MYIIINNYKMPKNISNDLKIAVINFYNSEFFNINNLFLI